MRRDSEHAAIGIGFLIVFIAVILVVGMAAFALLQVGQQLGIQSSKSGSTTITDVSLGVKISTIQGYVESGLIKKLVMIVTPWPGSPAVDLSTVRIELSDSNTKLVLNYNSSAFADATGGTNNVFTEPAFPTVGSSYGVIKLMDADGSCTASRPVLNRGDNVMVAFNASAGFGGIGVSQRVTGEFIPENGALSIISFFTPTAFADPVVILRPG